MADNKKSVLLYCDIITTVEQLDDQEAGRLFKHYLRYVNDKNPEPPDKLTQIVFEPIKQQLKRDLKKWEIGLEKKSDGGKLGMEKRWGKKNVESEKIKKFQEVVDKIAEEIPKIANFFYIGVDMYKSPISNFIKIEFGMFLESWQMQNSSIKVNEVLNEMDKQCVGKTFTGLDHIQNTFKKTAKELNKPSFNKKDEKATTTINFGKR